MEALELGVGFLTAALLAAILYQQIGNSEQQNIVSLKTARFCVGALALGALVMGLIGLWQMVRGGAA
jgi:hypothetical protein